MITYVPDYYSRFKCIADKCKHTCCKGWEIDVDEKSMERFKGHEDIISKIEDDSFILQGEEERCPFLRSDLLCQMIIDHGEDFICDICKDHPRFRNFYDDRIEMGIGLCCESACDLIIDNKEKFSLVPPKKLSVAIEVLNGFDKDILERLAFISPIFLSEEQIQDLYGEMEVLDENCAEIIRNRELDRNKIFDYIVANKSAFEQIALYYVYRYPQMTSFATEACMVIAGCAIALGGSIGDIKEAARIYSSEIEYSDVNIEMMKDVFEIIEEI